jgi:hypothetical protein
VLRIADCGLGRAAQSTRRRTTSSLRWVLLDSYTELFLRAFSPSAWDRLDLTLVPGHDLRAGAHRDRRRFDVCVFMCATRYLVALKRDVTIVNLPLPSTTGPVLLVELVPVST